MKNTMMKFLALGMAGAMIFSMTACASASSHSQQTSIAASAQSGMANPVHESDEQGVMKATGIDLPAPEGATEVSYQYIDMGEDANPIAQLNFTLDGMPYIPRASSSSLTSVGGSSDPDASIEDLMDTGSDEANISGEYYDWDAQATGIFTASNGQVMDTFFMANNSEKVSVLEWVDAAPGILYNLTCEKSADQDQLADTAAKVFVPLQGES